LAHIKTMLPTLVKQIYIVLKQPPNKNSIKKPT
jgi:hypothetical protein